MLPDSTGTDLDQHLSNLVGTTPPSNPMGANGAGGGGGSTGGGTGHPSLLPNGTQTAGGISTPNGSNGLIASRNQYTNSSAHEYNLQSGQNGGPRSLSDSSQAESPVQDDLLSSNTPTLGGNQFTQNQNYGSPTSGCNGSIYPVLPASILYSQLYTAANQSHSFHTHALQSGQNSMHGELQSVMDHIATSGNRQNHHSLMTGHTDLTIIGNCATAARGAGEASVRQGLGRGQPGTAENGNSVWRPY